VKVRCWCRDDDRAKMRRKGRAWDLLGRMDEEGLPEMQGPPPPNDCDRGREDSSSSSTMCESSSTVRNKVDLALDALSLVEASEIVTIGNTDIDDDHDNWHRHCNGFEMPSLSLSVKNKSTNSNVEVRAKQGLVTSTRGTFNSYSGEWKDGQMHGQGTLSFASGSEYSGNWYAGKQHGRGTFKYANGDIYEGDWMDGKKQGCGIYKFVNGDEYDGQIKDNKIHGNGTKMYKNGDIFEGEWMDGKRQGCAFINSPVEMSTLGTAMLTNGKAMVSSST
jgi:hypothetical protein